MSVPLRSFTVVGVCALAFAGTAACAPHPAEAPAGVSVGAADALPTPRVEPNDALPDVLAMHFSSLDVRRGERWSGEFVTGTSVASVEVRTNLFSIDVPRTTYGHFKFAVNVFDVPQIFIRVYRLRVIARNSAGVEWERDLPFRIR